MGRAADDEKQQEQTTKPSHDTKNNINIDNNIADNNRNNMAVNRSNKFGDIISISTPTGLIFTTVWVDTKLDPGILQIVISNDGRKVLKREKKPMPANSNEMLMGMYPWAQDKNNVVVAALNAEIKAVKKRETVATQWVETVLLDLPEECVRNMVNLNGDPTKEIKFKTDADGRQRIAFFLKTLRAHEDAPEAGTFSNCNVGGAAGTAGNPEGMDVGDDVDDFSTIEETVDDVRAEMDTRFQTMAAEVQSHTSNIRSEIRNDMENLFRQFMNSQANQQPPTAPADQVNSDMYWPELEIPLLVDLCEEISGLCNFPFSY